MRLWLDADWFDPGILVALRGKLINVSGTDRSTTERLLPGIHPPEMNQYLRHAERNHAPGSCGRTPLRSQSVVTNRPYRDEVPDLLNRQSDSSGTGHLMRYRWWIRPSTPTSTASATL